MAPLTTPARLGQYIFSNITSAIFGTSQPTAMPNEEDERSSSSHLPVQEPGQYEPFLADVLEVKSDLARGLKLPMELVDAIVDLAEYWPHTTTVRRNGEMTVRTGNGREENVFVLRSYPLGYLPGPNENTTCYMLDESAWPTIRPEPWPTTKEVTGEATASVRAKWLEACQMKSDHPCRKIVFTIKAHDQGWGGGANNRGTYKGSYTWFDVGKEDLVAFAPGQEPASLPSELKYKLDGPSDGSSKEKPITCAFHTIIPRTDSNQTSSDDTDIKYHFHHEPEPDSSCLQRNITADRNTKTHKVVWSCDDDINPESLLGNELEDQGRGRTTGNGEFVRNMKIGDVVTVWAKARFGAWMNVIQEVKIDVYWAV